jgi:hypothetical protein
MAGGKGHLAAVVANIRFQVVHRLVSIVAADMLPGFIIPLLRADALRCCPQPILQFIFAHYIEPETVLLGQ